MSGMPGHKQFPVAQAARIRLLLMDVDGTLTDGGLYYLPDGGVMNFALRFHVRDGLGLQRARQAGLLVGIISGRSSPQVRRRAEELGLDEIHLGVADKRAALEQILAQRGLSAGETCYIGDDVVDLPAMKLAGLSIAVADAHPDVRAAASWVTTLPGGAGAVREAVDAILAATRER